MCWFTCAVTKGYGVPRAVEGLGFLAASNSVHRGAEPERRPCFHDAVRTELAPPGYAVEEGAGPLSALSDLVEAVSARAGAGAWWVSANEGVVSETALDVRRLPDDAAPPPLEIAEFRRTRGAGGASGGLNRPARRAAGIGD